MLLGQLIDSSGIANAVRQGKQDSINNANMLVGSGVKAYENLKAYEEKQQLQDAIKSSINPDTGMPDQKLVLSTLSKVNPNLAYKQAQAFEQENNQRNMQAAELGQKQSQASVLNNKVNQDQMEQKLKGIETLQKMIIGVNDQIGYDRSLEMAKSMGIDVNHFPKEYHEDLKKWAWSQLVPVKDQLKDDLERTKLVVKQDEGALNRESKENQGLDKIISNETISGNKITSSENQGQLNRESREKIAGMKQNAELTPKQQADLDIKRETLDLKKKAMGEKQEKQDETEITKADANLRSNMIVKDKLNQIFKNGQFTEQYSGTVTTKPNLLSSSKSNITGTDENKFITAVKGLSDVLQTQGYSDIKKIGSPGSVSNAEWQKFANQYGLGSPEDLLKLSVDARVKAFSLLEKVLNDSESDNMKKKEKLTAKAKSQEVTKPVFNEDRYKQYLRSIGQ